MSGASPPPEHAAQATPASRGGRRRGEELYPALLLGAVLAGASVLLVSQARQLWFFGDDWSFLVGRPLDRDLLEPHNEHWSTLPLITYRVMRRLLGIDHYLLWSLMPIVLHLAVVVLVWRLLKRHGVSPWSAVLAVLPLALMAGSVAENPLWTFQIGFLGSVTFGLVALSLPGRTWYSTVGTWVATVASMACSGMALTMAVWLGLYVLLTRGWRAALVTTVPPGIVYVAWYATHALGSGESSGAFRPDAAVEFVWIGLTAVWQHLIPAPGAGVVVLAILVLVAALPQRRTPDVSRLLALAGMGAAASMYVLISFSRSSLGSDAAGAGRYSYVALTMMTPALALALQAAGDALAPAPRPRLLASSVLVVAVVVTGVAQTIGFRMDRELMNGAFREQMTATVAFLRSSPSRPVFGATPVDPVYNPDVTPDALLAPGVLARFPRTPPTDELLAEGALLTQATVSSSDLGLPSAEGLSRLHADGLLSGEKLAPFTGCVTITAAAPLGVLDIRPSSTGSQVVFVPSQEGVQLQMVGRGAISPARVVTTVPGRPVYVGSVSRDMVLRLLLPPGPATICSDLG